MSQLEINLTSDDILNKDFKTSLKGYNQDEVDKYLDLVIQDYKAFHTQIAELRKGAPQIADATSELLQQRIAELQTENAQMKRRFTDVYTENTHLKKKMADVQQENENLKKQLQEQQTKKSSSGYQQLSTPDILRRISNLEKHVFGDKLNDTL